MVSVAPLVGAWIEIVYADITSEMQEYVAPLVGAWIEIVYSPPSRAARASLPSWERGLKYYGKPAAVFGSVTSLPSWERGLKLLSRCKK